MLKVKPHDRVSADDILKNKILHLRAQDYSLRIKYSNAKNMFDKLTAENKGIQSKIDEQSLILKSYSSFDPSIEDQLDKQILEMKARIKQMKLRDSCSDKASKADNVNKDYQTNYNKAIFKFSEDNNPVPLQSIDYNTLHRRSVEVKSCKTNSILEY